MNKVKEIEVAFDTKKCPYYFSEINIKAIKCPECKSALLD